MAHSLDKPLCLRTIKDLKPGLENWKIKVKSKLTTPAPNEREYENKSVKGKRCVYELTDESGDIDIIAFNENAKRLDSKFNESQEFFVWGAKITTANKEYSFPDREYELKFDDDTVIEPVEGGLSLRGNETPRSHEMGAKQPQQNIFDPIPLNKVTKGKPDQMFQVLGFLEESLELEEKTNSKSKDTFFRKTLRLSDGEKTIDVSVIGEPEKLEELKNLNGQVIGLGGCAWRKEYATWFISARFKNLYKEDDCLQLAKDKVMELKKNGKKEGTTSQNMTEEKKTKRKKHSKDEGLTEVMGKLDLKK